MLTAYKDIKNKHALRFECLGAKWQNHVKMKTVSSNEMNLCQLLITTESTEYLCNNTNTNTLSSLESATYDHDKEEKLLHMALIRLLINCHINNIF